MTREVTEESFLKDVSKHEMTIIRDDGVHRHLRMKKPQSGDMYFDIVTYPHFLVYSGDMGCYVFSRIDDMFEFFRAGLRDPAKLQINEGYWAEKLEATDKPDGHKSYSPARFERYVNDRVKELLENELDEESCEDLAQTKEDLRQQIEDNILAYAHDNEYAARTALAEFEWITDTNLGKRRPFQDSWEANFYEYTFRFVWCLYAIVWTIREYDLRKVKT